METHEELAKVLYGLTPPHKHVEIDKLILQLKALSVNTKGKDFGGNHLSTSPEVLTALMLLAGNQERNTDSLISIEKEVQTGDIAIREVAQGNIYKYTINLYGLTETSNPVADNNFTASTTEEDIPTVRRISQDKDHLPISHAAFIAGPPIIHPSGFFGRTALLRRVFGLLKRLPLQHTVIIGPQRSGKTSLLHYLRLINNTPPVELRAGQRQDWLPNPDLYKWVFIDFQSGRLRTRSQLMKYILGSLSLKVPNPCTIERSLEVLSEGINNPTVFLIDELGAALRYCPELDDDFWESMRALPPEVNGRLGFVVSSHAQPKQLAQGFGYTSRFFNIFSTTRLSSFSTEEARELIASSPIPFNEDDVEWIIAESGSWPILVQYLCQERLLALENGNSGNDWREEVQSQLVVWRNYINEGIK